MEPEQADDLDYSEANVGSAQTQGVRKNISLKLKGKGRGRKGGRGKRVSTKKPVSTTDEGVENAETPAAGESADKFIESNLDEVISKLEAPAFSPMDKAFPEPLHQNQKLRWDHKVNLIGEKVTNPMIHCCEKCTLPILNYGRLLPCKHVFCFDCAKKSDKNCPKCEEKILKIEPTALGTVFMCNFGGSRHVPGSCGRTYLSQRDLQAHVNHRHLKVVSGTAALPPVSAASSQLSRDRRGYQVEFPTPEYKPPATIPTRPNLITVPIQDLPPAYVYHPPPPPPITAPPPMHVYSIPPPTVHHPPPYMSQWVPPIQPPPDLSYRPPYYQ